jgi:hypothetical protein
MTSFHRRTAVLVLALLLLATASWGYILVFKDGEKLVIEGRYRVIGDKVAVTLQSGAETEFPLSDIDLEKTEEMNKSARGSAVVLDGRQEEGYTGPPPEKTLADIMRERKAAPREPSRPEVETPRTVRRTPAGNVDLFALARRPLAAEQMQRIDAVLRRSGVRNAEAFQGTSSKRLLIDVMTAGRGEVFAALESCAAALVELRAEMPEIEALELAMATSSRSRAGQFVLDVEDAERLTSGSVTPAQHFVAEVLF